MMGENLYKYIYFKCICSYKNSNKKNKEKNLIKKHRVIKLILKLNVNYKNILVNNQQK